MASSDWSSQQTLDVNWDIPSNLRVDYQKEGKAAIVAVFKWNGVVHPYVPPVTKPTYDVIYGVLLNNSSYIAPNTSFSLALPPGCGQTCVQVRARYKLGTYYAYSGWSSPTCANNPPDLYCQRTNNNFNVAKTQNNISSRKRYALAIKNARAAASYSGTYIGGSCRNFN